MVNAVHFHFMTYNIHKGIGGVDRRYDPSRIVEAISHCKPDVVFLQEVDDGVPRSRKHRQVDVLAEILGFHHCAFQPNVQLRTGQYGNAILSRFPLTDVRHLDVTIPLKKCRRVLAAHCRVQTEEHSRTVLLMNMHLGLAAFERRMQLRKLMQWELFQNTHRDTAVIAAGDFNDIWGTLGQRILEPEGFQAASGKINTFPAIMPVRPLDRVYYRGRLEVDHGYASRTETARQASDHLPLVTEFKLT